MAERTAAADQASGVPAADSGARMWPEHGRVTVAWRQSVRGGTSDDRRLGEIVVRTPPYIATSTPVISSVTAAAVESAMREITVLDRAHVGRLDALGALLLRTESVASSKIEHVAARLDDYARALHGSRANASAVSMVAATSALDSLLATVTSTGRIELDTVLAAHRALMADDPWEAPYAGKLRTMQTWIGGSDHSPRNALYIPPPPETVPGHMEDLLAFANRDDMPALVQAAVVHAQFESIHPFTDGNGRIGRGLINAVLRRRHATTTVVVPLASALVAHRDRYFATLGGYRDGLLEPLVGSFAHACVIAAVQSQTTAHRLAAIPTTWRSGLGRVRRGGPVDLLLDHLLAHPVVTAEDVAAAVSAPSTSTVYAAIIRLQEAEILRLLTDRKRDQIWGAADVLAELDDLGIRIERAAH